MPFNLFLSHGKNFFKKRGCLLWHKHTSSKNKYTSSFSVALLYFYTNVCRFMLLINQLKLMQSINNDLFNWMKGLLNVNEMPSCRLLTFRFMLQLITKDPCARQACRKTHSLCISPTHAVLVCGGWIGPFMSWGNVELWIGLGGPYLSVLHPVCLVWVAWRMWMNVNWVSYCWGRLLNHWQASFWVWVLCPTHPLPSTSPPSPQKASTF